MTETLEPYSNKTETNGDLSHYLVESGSRSSRESGRRMIGAGALAIAAAMAPSVAMAEDQLDSSEAEFSQLDSRIVGNYEMPIYSSPQVLFENDSLSIIRPSTNLAEEVSPEPSFSPQPEITPEPTFTPVPEITPSPEPTPAPTLTPEPTPIPTPEPTKKPEQQENKIYTKNLYDKDVFRYQPNNRDCVATTVNNVLNFTAKNGHKGPNFRWKVNTSNVAIARTRAFTRGHDTLSPAGVGSDAVGIRNVVNYLGWGKYKNPKNRVYEIKTYPNRKIAKRKIAKAIAKTDRPAFIISWRGKHVEAATGYKVRGKNPKYSDDFKVLGIRVSDPWPGDHSRNRLVSNGELYNGSYTRRLTFYGEKDSPYMDKFAEYEWLRKRPSWKNVYKKITVVIPTK